MDISKVRCIPLFCYYSPHSVSKWQLYVVWSFAKRSNNIHFHFKRFFFNWLEYGNNYKTCAFSFRSFYSVLDRITAYCRGWLVIYCLNVSRWNNGHCWSDPISEGSFHALCVLLSNTLTPLRTVHSNTQNTAVIIPEVTHKRSGFLLAPIDNLPSSRLNELPCVAQKKSVAYHPMMKCKQAIIDSHRGCREVGAARQSPHPGGSGSHRSCHVTHALE